MSTLISVANYQKDFKCPIESQSPSPSYIIKPKLRKLLTWPVTQTLHVHYRMFNPLDSLVVQTFAIPLRLKDRPQKLDLTEGPLFLFNSEEK